MRTLCLSICSVLLALSSIDAQQVVDLKENDPHKANGLEYGYYITNESSKEVKGENFDRYELNLYVTNNSGCIRIIPFKSGWTGSTSSSDEVMIGEFNCTNATGKRLTAKKGHVSARPWFTNVRIPDETAKEKYKTVNAQVGYAVRNGQTITNRIIVIVPKGQRPKVNCRMVYLPEIQ